MTNLIDKIDIEQYKIDWQTNNNTQLARKYNVGMSTIGKWNHHLRLVREKNRKDNPLITGKMGRKPQSPEQKAAAYERKKARERVRTATLRAKAEGREITQQEIDCAWNNIRPEKKAKRRLKYAEKKAAVTGSVLTEGRKLKILEKPKKQSGPRKRGQSSKVQPKTETVTQQSHRRLIQKVFETKKVDRSNLHLHKVDNKTWIEVSKKDSLQEMERKSLPVIKALNRFKQQKTA